MYLKVITSWGERERTRVCVQGTDSEVQKEEYVVKVGDMGTSTRRRSVIPDRFYVLASPS